MILAGFFTQVSLTWIIYIATSGNEQQEFEFDIDGRNISVVIYNVWFFSDVCRPNGGIAWLLLILISAGVAFLTIVKSEGDKIPQGIMAFSTSFLLNCGGWGLGYMAIHCSRYEINLSDEFWHENLMHSYDEMRKIHAYTFIPMMILASIGITVHLIKSNPQATKLPDPEIVLLGICLQLAIWYSIVVSEDGDYDFCKIGGIGSWLLVLALSCQLSFQSLLSSKLPPVSGYQGYALHL